MPWPMSQDYNEAVQSPATHFADPDLRRGKAATNALGLPAPCSGNFADVYQVCCPDGARWAVKCFTRETAGLRERYQEISRHLRQVQLPFMVEFTYLEPGIRVGGDWHSVLKMQWVEGLMLNQFVGKYADNPAMLEALLQIWGRMARHLRSAGAAHCDLQHGNVLLVPGASANSLALKLIDYDGMFVPALAGRPSGEVGHPSYQHPQRLREGTYSLEVDRFPLLLVATALRALKAGGRELWEKYDDGDNLLFRREDLEAPGKSALFDELLNLSDPSVRFLAENLIDAARKPLEQTPLLEVLVPGGQTSPARAEGRQAAPAVTAAPPEVAVVPLALALAPEATFGPPETEFAPLQPDGERGASWRAPAPFWIALAGALALLGALAGVIVLVAYFRAGGPQKRQALAPQDSRAAKTKRTIPTEKAPPPTDPVGGTRRTDPVGEIRRFTGHAGGVVDVAFAPDGRTAASGGQDKVIRLWDVETGKEVRRFEGHTGRVTCLCFTPDGLHVVSGSYDKTLRVWDVASGKEVRRLEGHTYSVGPVVVVTPDGQRVLSCSGDSDTTVRIWDLNSSKEVRRFDYRGRNDESIGVAAFSADGRRALVWRRFEYQGKKEESLRLWDVDQGGMLRLLHEHSPGGAFSPDGQFAVAFGLDKHLRLYDVGSWKLIRRFEQGPAGVHNAAFSPDGRRVLVGYDQQDYAGLWGVESGKEVYRLPGNPKGVTRIIFSPDGRRALSAGRDGSIRLWGLPD